MTATLSTGGLTMTSVRYIRTDQLPAGQNALLVQNGSDVTWLIRSDLLTEEGAAVLSETASEAMRRWWAAE